MLRAVLVGILLCLGILIIEDRSRQSAAIHRTVAPPAARPANAVAPPPSRQAVMAPTLPADAPPPPTPTIDLLERLSIRRRLDREGSRVYLDSLLAHTDSVLARWSDRPDRSISVVFVVDTTVPGWTPAALDDARAGMHQWDGNQAGIAFREGGTADSADVRVQWVGALGDSAQVGSTTLTWGPDGIVHAGVITLALHRNTDSMALTPAARQRVAAHEFGHALGLPHSDSPDDLMFANAPVASPSRRDQATLMLLYAVPAGPLGLPRP